MPKNFANVSELIDSIHEFSDNIDLAVIPPDPAAVTDEEDFDDDLFDTNDGFDLYYILYFIILLLLFLVFK